MSFVSRRFFAAVSVCLFLHSTGSINATDCDRLDAGDTVFSACPGAVFEPEIAAPASASVALREGVPIQISRVSGSRVQGIVEVDGSPRSGWIAADQVQKPDDAASVAALLQVPEIRVHRNRYGAVHRIDAQDTHFGGENLEPLQGLYSLEGLELSGSRVTNEDLRFVGGLSNLRWLYLDRTSVNDEGLLELRRLTNLEALVLSQSDVRGPGLVHLARLRRLRVLNLSDCKLDDDALRHLQGLTQVQTLALENAPIRGEGLIYLQPMQRLNVLNLNGCSLRPGTLLNLRSTADLRIVRVRATEIPLADRQALLAANPRLAIFN